MFINLGARVLSKYSSKSFDNSANVPEIKV